MLGAEYLEFEAVRRGVRGLRFEPLSCGRQVLRMNCSCPAGAIQRRPPIR
jgi:hypothetical protein